MIQDFVIDIDAGPLSSMDTKKTLFKLVDALDQHARDLLYENPNLPYHIFQRQSFERTTFLQTIKTLRPLNGLIHAFQEEVARWAEQSNPKDSSAFIQALLEPGVRLSQFIKGHPSITVMGAGTAGLLAAYVLARAGYRVTVYEARERADAFLRPQNISFKEAEPRLKPLIGEACYARFFTRGGALDGHSGKLRITIGAFQEILTEELLSLGADIHYGASQTLEDIYEAAESSVVLLATGVHSHEQLELTDLFQIETFSQYTVSGRTALYLEETEEVPGYLRYEREGSDWRRVNKTVYDYDAMAPDVQRILQNLEKWNHTSPYLERLKSFSTQHRIDCTFIFGNDSALFLENLETTPKYPPVITTQYQIIPTIALSLMVEHTPYPVIAMGDLNGSPHPLAAIGTLKFVRNIEHLLHFLNRFHLIQQIASHHSSVEEKTQTTSLLEIAKKLYVEHALQNTMEVFLSNILSCIYSSQGVRTP